MTARSSRVRFAANLKWLFTELPFLERFEAAALHGFAAVEYASPYGYDATELRNVLSQRSLKQVLINTPAGEAGAVGSNGFGCIPGYVDVFREGVDLALNYANALECSLIHLMAGRVPDGCSPAKAEAVFRSNLAWAAKRAEGQNVTFVLECLNQQDVPGYFLKSLAQASAYVRDIPQGNVKLLFDFYHAAMSGMDVLDAFAMHRRDVAHIQVADVPGRNEPGTGDMSWPTIARAIADSGYSGWIGCEYRPRGTTAAGLDWRQAFTQAAGLSMHSEHRF
ncbi:TIM barrel protein [Caballeronia sp. GAWG2-1]|uniref:hydroxypyruvate isomerase family protein n=1 Tax=Caballeronia sp. GAWG2-1 TaxID=2921744 RepID=UPI0020283717|nr:TIM barrel protein [Caballeronia sp. GAWG2-1]